MKSKLLIFSGIIFLLLGLYAHWPSPPLPPNTIADSVVVHKSERKLTLLKGKEILKTYTVALGAAPVGHKSQEGDEKTPEGSYIIDYRKMDSAFHVALHISYPDENDKKQAELKNVQPGGLIMIHGIRNGFGFIGRLHSFLDWTNGCIAVTNTEIEEIERAVPDGTPIYIYS